MATRRQEVATNALVPPCVTWSTDEVADWIESIGHGTYRECFLDNFIDGRKMIYLEADKLPNIGITDFKHIQEIALAIRELLQQPAPDHNRCFSLPHRGKLGLFLEQKARTGDKADSLTYSHYLKVNDRKLNKLLWK